MGFLWKETPEWGQTVAIEGEDKIRISLPENTTSKEREAKLIVWAANKDYNELDMQKDKCDTTVVVIKQKGKKEFHVPDIKDVTVAFSLTNSETGWSSDLVSINREYGQEIQTEKYGNGLRVTTNGTSQNNGTKEEYEISFIINGYDGQEFTDAAYVTDLKFRHVISTETMKRTWEMAAEEVEFESYDNIFHSLKFKSLYPNIKVTSFKDIMDDTYVDIHYSITMADLQLKGGNYLTVDVRW